MGPDCLPGAPALWLMVLLLPISALISYTCPPLRQAVSGIHGSTKNHQKPREEKKRGKKVLSAHGESCWKFTSQTHSLTSTSFQSSQCNTFQTCTTLFTCIALDLCLPLKVIFAVISLSNLPREQNLLSNDQTKSGCSHPSKPVWCMHSEYLCDTIYLNQLFLAHDIFWRGCWLHHCWFTATCETSPLTAGQFCRFSWHRGPAAGSQLLNISVCPLSGV